MHDPIDSLKEAIAASPESAPLWKSLGDLCLASGLADQAESAYRKALALSPASAPIKVGLARAFHRQGKRNEALVLLEEMVRGPQALPEARVLLARLMLERGEIESAVAQYKAAVEEKPELADEELGERLGVSTSPATPPEGEVFEGKMRAGWEAPQENELGEVERPAAGFHDVGGMEEVKEEIRLKIVYPLKNPQIYAAYGKKTGGGVLLYGPPGCGKTHLARATAGEISASFLSIGINDILDMWIGSSERNLHELFEKARRNRPCVLFVDEVDALGGKRSDLKHSGARFLINQFLSELDGIEQNNEGLLILAATNSPWHMDSAFLRPGRFDRVIFIPPPDAPAREAILRIHCKGKPLADVDFVYVAKLTENFSGADLQSLVDRAIEGKLKQALKTGVPTPLTTADLKAAAKAIKPTSADWFATAKNFALYANQSGLYDDILAHLKR